MYDGIVAPALSIISAGISVLPIRMSEDSGEAKRPAVDSWKKYQSTRMTEEEAKVLFASTDRIAVIGGKISGNLEILDFDEAGVCQKWFVELESLDKALADRLYVEESPSGGHHVLYRTEEDVAGNLKIAMRPNEQGQDVIVETRGEGGYCIIAPTPGYVAKRGSIENLPTLVAAQRELLIALAARHDEREPINVSKRSSAARSKARGSNRPGDDYNLRGDWYELLERHGWSFEGQSGCFDYWTRPGKASGISASVGWNDDGTQGYLSVFSTSTPFETFTEKSYDLFGAHAVLEHGGDFSEAAKALRDLGYGEDQDQRDEILNVPEDLHSMVVGCLDALEKANDPPRWFVRNRRLVRVDHSEEPIICEVNQPQLLEVMSKCVKFFRLKPVEGGDSIRVYMGIPNKVIQCLFQRQLYGEIPPIRGLVTCPVVLPNGALVTDAGYIPSLKMLKTTEDATEVTEVTKVELNHAVAWINDVLTDFAFADEASRANTFAAILTPILRPYIEEATPFLRIEAFQQSTGKSLLAKTIMAFTYPSMMPATEYTKNEEEFAKKLQAMLNSARPFIFIDNVVGRVQNQVLDSIVTERKIEFRQLGNNTTPIIAECNGEIILTANNCYLSKDLALRGYTVLLDAKCSNPEERTGFKHANPARYVLDHRPEATNAAVTIVKWWLQSGMPLAHDKSKLIRFDHWARVLGGVLETAGITGFLANQDQMVRSADPEADAWKCFIQEWHKQHGSDPVRIGQVLDIAFGAKNPVGTRKSEEGLLTEFFTYAKNDQSMQSALAKRLPRGVFAVVEDGAEITVQVTESSHRGHKHYSLVEQQPKTSVASVTSVVATKPSAVADDSDELDLCLTADDFLLPCDRHCQVASVM